MKDQSILVNNGVDLQKSLELFGDINMYDDSLGDFMAEIENKLYKISHFKEMNDMDNYAILVHSLKSDARYFGFTLLADLSYAHELESKANNTIFVNENYNALINEANRIVNVVREYLKSSSNQSSDVPNINETPTINETHTPTILVADDSEIIIKIVEKTFSNKYNILTAKDGQEAINYLKECNQYNIVGFLLDLNMPKVDGFKVLEYMEENNLFSKVPVSIITGTDSVEINLNAFKFPIVDILRKPFTESALNNILERTINHRSNIGM